MYSDVMKDGARFILPLAGLILLAACTAAGSEEGALLRGDEAFARGDVPEALAEYRLALRQGNRGVDVLVRTAHAYAWSGRIAEAREHYGEAIEADPEVADLAAADLLRVAKRATERGDGIGAATAVEAAMALKPGVSLTGVSLQLARYFARNGQHGQALSFFQQAVRETGSDPDVLFEMALTHEELGDCRRALLFFEQVRDEVSAARRSEVEWNVGNCSFELAREAYEEEEDLEEALRLYEATIELGEPRNLLGQAWFEKGEIHAQRGECTAAVAAFEQVLREDLAGAFLMEQARNRVDEIRFSRSGDGPC